MPLPNYFDAMDYPALIGAFSRPEDFATRIGRRSRENCAPGRMRSS